MKLSLTKVVSYSIMIVMLDVANYKKIINVYIIDRRDGLVYQKTGY
jgi:hypothetical protein